MSDVKKLRSALQVVLDRAVEEGNVAGMNALIRQGGKDIAYVQSGYADIENKKEFKRDTIMRVYSMSKPITSAAVMILVERGLIGMGEPVSKYLPGFKDQVILTEDGAKPVARPAYIRDLMCMTSGLPYGNLEGSPAEKEAQKVFDEIDKRLYTDDPMGTVEIANRLGQAGLSFQPGKLWQYGTSADILGAVVEVVSGMSFGEFLRKEIFEPLGMEDTGFWVPADKQARVAEVYERREGVLEHFKTNHLGIKYTLDKEPAFQSGGAGLTSTIDDYAKFAQMLQNGGEYNGHRILNKRTVEYMAHGALTPSQREYLWSTWDSLCGYDYGCLMRHAVNPEMAYFYTWQDEYGWDGWLGTFFANVPGKTDATILLGMQISNLDGNFISEKVRNTVAQYLA
ncbi:MAG: beta-lactamase family protein [Lachnospiraceae bacterium]|nr:beta-lactamase family protein [Lachnospiraceae bacterium]